MFYFEDSMEQPLFAPNETSRTLVVKTASGHLTPMIWEIDSTNTVPGVHGDISIDLIPEPTSMALLGIGAFLLSLRRSQKT
jgi:hypothetical protein